ncbi:MAG: histidinol-phosphate transaminase [Candidatus Omnitrophota bacterium]
MKELARKEIFKVAPYVPGKPIEEVQREMGLKEVIKLASNESPLPPSKRAIKAIVTAAKGLNRYPDGSSYYLRRKLARKLRVNENQFTLGNGSDELIVLAVRALVNPGEEIIVAKPTFLIYGIAATISGAKVIAVPMKDFRYDLEAMQAKISPRTKLIFIANPDNPTGSYVTQTEVEKFLEGIPENILVFFDEAYFELVDKQDYPDTIELQKRYRNLVISRTFSKAYSLAGLRLGYCIADKTIAECLNRVREPFNINSLAQEAALVSLDDTSRLKALKKLIREGREYLIDNFEELGLEFVPPAANFILINLKQNGSSIAGRLLKQGVIVRDMSSWGLKNFIRVTVGTMRENRKFVAELKRIITIK